MDTGAVICEAEGFVGDDERTWAKRDEFAKRAMAQTRAISRACRSAFAFIVTYMDAGLETTPAEEVPAEGFSDSPRPAPANRPAPRLNGGRSSMWWPSASNPAAPIRKKQPVAATPTREQIGRTGPLHQSCAPGQALERRPAKAYTQLGRLRRDRRGRNGSEVWLNTIKREWAQSIDAGEPANTCPCANQRR
jgi:hypothetical protein